MNTIGILVDDEVFRNLKSKRTGSEKIHLYNKAASAYNLTPVYLSLTRIDPGRGTARGYTFTRGQYKYGLIKIPRVIHNRTFPGSSRSKRILNRLNRISYVFNARNRYSKYRIHRMLRDAFQSNIPHTVDYSKSNLRRMMDHYESLYIKPQKGSVGNGIIKLSRGHGSKWIVQLPKGTRTGTKKSAGKLVHLAAKKKPYLIQEGISLDKYRGKPYDIRASVQRGGDGEWQVTGIVGKVARRGSHVTNLARGGKAIRCSVLFRHMKHPDQVADSVKELSLKITKYLGKRLKRLADVGLDIGVNREGKPYFIELNCRDQRYSFRKAKLSRTFYETYANPVRYAKYLLGRRVDS